jgi:hypothetical protein
MKDEGDTTGSTFLLQKLAYVLYMNKTMNLTLAERSVGP